MLDDSGCLAPNGQNDGALRLPELFDELARSSPKRRSGVTTMLDITSDIQSLTNVSWCVEKDQIDHAIQDRETAAGPETAQENSELVSMQTALASGALCNNSTTLKNLRRYETN